MAHSWLAVSARCCRMASKPQEDSGCGKWLASLCRKVATDNMLQIIEAHPNWPVYADVFEHPPPRLASRRPIWSDMTSVDTITQWREDCRRLLWSTTLLLPTQLSDSQVLISLIIHFSLMNCFQTSQGLHRANLHKWGLAQSPSCDCG